MERRRFITTRKALLWLAKGPLAISVGFWRSASSSAASYKALFMHLM